MPTTVVVPFAPTMNTSGDGSLETLKTNVFAWSTAADATFNDTTSMSAAVLRNMFTVSESPDNAADISVSINNGDAFKAALLASLKGGAKLAATAGTYTIPNSAGNNVTVGSSGVKAFMLNVAQHDIDAALETDGIAAALEAEHVKGLKLDNFDIDASQASIDMYNGLALTENLRKIIALQYNNAAYKASPTDGTDAADPTIIPFATGDSVVFRFLLDQAYTITQDPKAMTSNPAGSTPVDSSLTQGSGQYGTSPFASPAAGYIVDQRVIDITMTLVA